MTTCDCGEKQWSENFGCLWDEETKIMHNPPGLHCDQCIECECSKFPIGSAVAHGDYMRHNEDKCIKVDELTESLWYHSTNIYRYITAYFPKSKINFI